MFLVVVRVVCEHGDCEAELMMSTGVWRTPAAIARTMVVEKRCASQEHVVLNAVSNQVEI